MNIVSLRLCGLALVVAAGLNSVTFACDCPSQSELSAMGLGELVVMSDSEGLSVRGFGYAPVSVAGKGWAVVSYKGASAGSKNSYSASGKRAAWGSNDSEAGVKIKSGHHTKSISAWSGGSSRAGRK